MSTPSRRAIQPPRPLTLGVDASLAYLPGAGQRASVYLAGSRGDARRGRDRDAARLPTQVGGAGRLAGDRLPAGDPAHLDRLGPAPRAVCFDRQRPRLQLLPDPAAAPL